MNNRANLKNMKMQKQRKIFSYISASIFMPIILLWLSATVGFNYQGLTEIFKNLFKLDINDIKIEISLAILAFTLAITAISQPGYQVYQAMVEYGNKLDKKRFLKSKNKIDLSVLIKKINRKINKTLNAIQNNLFHIFLSIDKLQMKFRRTYIALKSTPP